MSLTPENNNDIYSLLQLATLSEKGMKVNWTAIMETHTEFQAHLEELGENPPDFQLGISDYFMDEDIWGQIMMDFVNDVKTRTQTIE